MASSSFEQHTPLSSVEMYIFLIKTLNSRGGTRPLKATKPYGCELLQHDGIDVQTTRDTDPCEFL